MSAILEDDVQRLRESLSRGADPNTRASGLVVSPLHLAILTGSVEQVTALLEAGGNPNAIDNIGRTVLHYAAISPKGPAMIPHLLDAGADVNAKTPEGATPLDLAAGAGDAATATPLRRAGGECRSDRRAWVDRVTGRKRGGRFP